MGAKKMVNCDTGLRFIVFVGLVFLACFCFSLSSDAADWHDIDVVLPKNAPKIKSDYNDPKAIDGISNRERPHIGIDIVESVGYPVLAPADGQVKNIRRNRDGLGLEIWHAVNYYTTIITNYLHLNSVKVKKGEYVNRGEQIATIGKTGGRSMGIPHLHFMLGRGQNPHKYWIGGPGKIVCFEPGKKYQPKGQNIFTYPVACY